MKYGINELAHLINVQILHKKGIEKGRRSSCH